jgi:hypothetical protein
MQSHRSWIGKGPTGTDQLPHDPADGDRDGRGARRSCQPSSSPRVNRRRSSIAYVIGVALAVVIGVSLVYTVASVLDVSVSSREYSSKGPVDCAIIALLLFLMVRVYLRRNDTEPPKWMGRRSPDLGERVVYCPSSMWFDDSAHGDKFDRLGNYVLGPAPGGLDRLATLVQDGVVWVNPNDITLGLREDRTMSSPRVPSVQAATNSSSDICVTPHPLDPRTTFLVRRQDGDLLPRIVLDLLRTIPAVSLPDSQTPATVPRSPPMDPKPTTQS